MPMDASATIDSVGRSIRLDLCLYHYRPYIEPMQWQQRMDDSHQWWILSAAQVAAMTLPVPGGRLFTKQVGKAITKMPMLAVTMIGNLFKLKGANKKFIHTEHGEHHK